MMVNRKKVLKIHFIVHRRLHAATDCDFVREFDRIVPKEKYENEIDYKTQTTNIRRICRNTSSWKPNTFFFVVVDNNERTFGNWNTADMLAQVLLAQRAWMERCITMQKVNVLAYT